MELPSKDAIAQAKLWLRFEDGTVALEGTACLGRERPGMQISQQLAKSKPLNDKLLILELLAVGQKSKRLPVCIKDYDMNLTELGHDTFPYTLRSKLKIITEKHDWFNEDTGHTSPWQAATFPPETIVAAMSPQGLPCQPKRGATGLLGGCEIRLINGPPLVGEEYELETEVISLGETPKTEFYWTRSTLYHVHATNVIVAEMELQSMLLKNSYPGPKERGYAQTPSLPPNEKKSRL
jgi:hypothetical protein